MDNKTVAGDFKLEIESITRKVTIVDCGHTQFQPRKGGATGPKKYRAEVSLGKSQHEQSAEGDTPRKAIDALAHKLNGTVKSFSVTAMPK